MAPQLGGHLISSHHLIAPTVFCLTGLHLQSVLTLIDLKSCRTTDSDSKHRWNTVLKTSAKGWRLPSHYSYAEIPSSSYQREEYVCSQRRLRDTVTSSVKKSFIKVKTNVGISKKHPIWAFVSPLRVGRKDIKRKNQDGKKSWFWTQTLCWIHWCLFWVFIRCNMHQFYEPKLYYYH